MLIGPEGLRWGIDKFDAPVSAAPGSGIVVVTVVAGLLHVPSPEGCDPNNTLNPVMPLGIRKDCE